jgi:hypothetical protein
MLRKSLIAFTAATVSVLDRRLWLRDLGTL